MVTVLKVIKATAPEINFEESYTVFDQTESTFLPSTELVLLRQSLANATNPVDRYSIEHQLTKLYYNTYKRSGSLFPHQKYLVELGNILFSDSEDTEHDIKEIKSIGRELKKLDVWCQKWMISRLPMFRNVLTMLWGERPNYD